MKSLVKYIAENDGLKNIISSSSFVKKIAKKFVLGQSLDNASFLIGNWNKNGFGIILYPIEADAQDYVDSLRFLSEKKIRGSVSLRTPLKNLDSVVEVAEKTGIRLELDMRSPQTVDQALQCYSGIIKKHANSVICLQANLYRTAGDIENLAHLSPIVRLVKGAFYGEYQSKRDINSNFLRLAETLMNKGIKAYFATHDEKIINQLIESNKAAGKKQFGFQMLYGVRQDLQDKLRDEGYEVWKYAAYGEDWVPYCMNRMLERKENIKFALEALLRR